jgi:hypothetical protein
MTSTSLPACRHPTDYVVLAVGGNSILEPKVADQLVAYSLP